MKIKDIKSAFEMFTKGYGCCTCMLTYGKEKNITMTLSLLNCILHYKMQHFSVFHLTVNVTKKRNAISTVSS